MRKKNEYEHKPIENEDDINSLSGISSLYIIPSLYYL